MNLTHAMDGTERCSKVGPIRTDLPNVPRYNGTQALPYFFRVLATERELSLSFAKSGRALKAHVGQLVSQCLVTNIDGTNALKSHHVPVWPKSSTYVECHEVVECDIDACPNCAHQLHVSISLPHPTILSISSG